MSLSEATHTADDDRASEAGSAPRPREDTRVHLVSAFALLFTGLLAGAFSYGAVNVAQTFKAVPLDVRLTFHTALMKMNGPVMQTTMALAALSTVLLAVLTRRPVRRLAGLAGALVLTTFLVTRFGNVPINAQIKVWAVSTAPPDHAAILRRWELFNDVRTAAALSAFVLMVIVVCTPWRAVNGDRP